MIRFNKSSSAAFGVGYFGTALLLLTLKIYQDITYNYFLLLLDLGLSCCILVGLYVARTHWRKV